MVGSPGFFTAALGDAELSIGAIFLLRCFHGGCFKDYVDNVNISIEICLPDIIYTLPPIMANIVIKENHPCGP